jgi:cell division protein FtsW (lipid II flippase)
MRVISPTVTQVRPDVRRIRALNLELLGLLAATVIVSFGIALAFLAKVAAAESMAPSGGRVVPLYAVKSPADLEAVLTMFPSLHERQVVAQAIYRDVASAESRLEHVGGLMAVTMSAADIRQDPGLTRLRERLERRATAEAVPVLSASDLAAVKPSVTVRTARQFSSRAIRAFGLLLGGFWIVHLFRRWRQRDDDPVVLPAVMLLCGVGAMAMLGLRDPLRDTMAFGTFAGGVALGLAALLLASEVDFESSWLRRAVILPLLLALGLALLLLLFGSGPGSSGVKVNLFGGQPVEIIRLLVIFALAAYFGRRIELLRVLSERATPSRRWLRYFRMPRWIDVRPVLASMGLVLLFFFFQKDLGPALVLTCVFLALYGIGRGHAAFVIAGFALLLAGFAAAYWIGEPATVRQRVAIWVNPWNNGVAGGNQIAHGLWALSTGGAWGSGPGLGNPEMVPAGHTDFVLAAIGEELGFVGILSVLLLYGLLTWRALRAGLRAPGDYSAFLAVGVSLGLVVQALVIASGLLGLVPLSGVVTPFLSFGRSSMLANCFAVGIVLAIARRRGPRREHLRRPVGALAGALVLSAAMVCARAAWVQVVRADDFAAAASLSEQADGGYRFEHNPRLLHAARTLVRGTIYDRNGLPLATSRVDEIASIQTIYRAAGIEPAQACEGSESRCYPLGGPTYHLVGDWDHQTNWGASNSSYVERDSDARLKGYDDHTRLIVVRNPRTGRRHPAIARDYRELLPLVRQQHWPRSTAITVLRARARDLHTSIDARLQVRASAALQNRIQAGGHSRGAAVILDAGNGEVLASVSYPWPGKGDLKPGGEELDDERGATDRWLDRARYGLYPPGSVFKLLIAGAALREHAERSTFSCVRLPGGRVGNSIRGSARPVRDDPKDTVPHGSLDLHGALVVSCNAYFAQLAQRLGPGPVLDAASLFQIDVARTPDAEELRPTLAHAGYGQGQVVTSPLKMARISAAVAAGGLVAPVRWFVAAPGAKAEAPSPGSRFLSPSQAAQLGQAMREVVTLGTARSLRSPVPVAGKTGTAEIGQGAAHSWFTGFAPDGGSGRRVAFAVLVENAGYGARAAAPVAGELVTATRELGLIK